ncbi:MAG: DNA sulfur modification protein DndD [FCB group bacterium]|jgi:DNA sulfur modification protein DndD
MKIKKITIENYKTFALTTIIEFPENEDGKSIFLIGGMNGAGKTTIMEAINYCLYGVKQEMIFKGINNSEKSNGNTYVAFELLLETDEGSEILVKRSWSAGTNVNPKSRDLEEKLIVIKDGKRVSVENKQIFQDFVNITFPRGITQFFFFDGEKIQEIAADDHSEMRLKSSLEAALGIQYISKLKEDILEIKKIDRRNVVEITNEDIEYKESEYKKEKKNLEKKQEEEKDINEELDKFKEEYDNSKQKFTAIFSTEPETAESIKQKEKKRIQLSTRLGHIESEIKNISEKYLTFALACNIFPTLKEQINNEKELSKNSVIKENATELIDKIIYTHDNPTPITDLPLTDFQKFEYKKRLTNVMEITKMDQPKERILNLSDKDAVKVQLRIEEIENSDLYILNDLIDEKIEINNELKKLEFDLSLSVSSSSEKDLFNDLQSMMESCSMQIGRKTEQLRNIEEDVLHLEKRLNDIEIELNKLYEKHQSSIKKINFINKCDAIAEMLDQYIIILRENKIKLLEEKTFEMYRKLSTKSGLIKEMNIDNKSYEIRIMDKDGHEIKKSGLSAGEKEIFAVSLLWGLAKTSQLNLPIIIDTPLSRLDSTHRDNIIKYYFPTAADQVIILSTDTEIDKDYFKQLEQHLSGCTRLVFDDLRKITVVEKGYFWN